MSLSSLIRLLPAILKIDISGQKRCQNACVLNELEGKILIVGCPVLQKQFLLEISGCFLFLFYKLRMLVECE